MRETAKNSYALSVDIAEQLVIKKAMPFRLAHKLVGCLVEKGSSPKQRPDYDVRRTRY